MSAHRFPCCVCCPDVDPTWHEVNGEDRHEGPCPICNGTAAESGYMAEVERLHGLLTEARRERDAVGQDLAQVAWEREQYKLAAEAASNDRVVLRVRRAAVEDERGALAARLAAVEALLTGKGVCLCVKESDLRAALAAPTDTTKEN